MEGAFYENWEFTASLGKTLILGDLTSLLNDTDPFGWQSLPGSVTWVVNLSQLDVILSSLVFGFLFIVDC